MERVKRLYLHNPLNKNEYLLNASEEELVKEAKEKANQNKEDLLANINENRQLSAKNDFEKHLRYCILISLALTLFGRYLIKGIKWVAANKT